jgi:protein SCO1/2
LTTIWRSSLLLLAAALAACGNPGAAKFRGTDVTGADFGKTLALTGHDGKPRVLGDFRGKLVVLFFGYTHCPDICPTTLADTAAALKTLGPDAARVQVLFVTLDPERDTPELLAKYVPYFSPDFLGLSGDAAATERTAKEFKIFYEKRPGAAPGAYTVDHSAQVYVLDAEGRLRLVERNERISQDLAPDLRALLKG